MANMIEQSLLCKVLDAPDLEILHSNGVIEEMFLTCKDEIHFIIEHYNSYKQMPDKLTFLGRFKDFQMLEVTESTDYLVYKLKEAYTYTKLVPLIEDTAKVVKEDSIKAIQYLKEEIEKLEKSVPVSRNKDGYDIISNAGDRLTEYKKRCEVKGLIGIPTGIPKLDEITNGWLWGEDLVVLTGRTNVGKTWIGEYFATMAWNMGYKILMYSGEMSTAMVGFRFDTLNKHFSNMGLLNGSGTLGKKPDTDGAKYLQEDYEKYITQLQQKSGFIVVTPDDFEGRKPNVDEIKSLAIKHGADMIVIDQLSLMSDKRRADIPRIAYNNISEDLFLMSKELKKPVLLMAQANREAVKNRKKGESPELHDLAESDGVGQNATRVLSLSVIDGTLSRTCQYCRADNGKVFKRGEEPTLPRHPNCRCVYIPVVSDTFEDNELNDLTRSVRGAENYEKWREAEAKKQEEVKPVEKVNTKTVEKELKENPTPVPEQIKLTDYPQAFYATKPEAKNTQALLDYMNSKISTDPNVVALYTKMDKLCEGLSDEVVLKVTHGEHRVKRSWNRNFEYVLDVGIPKINPKYIGTYDTNLHEEMHFLDMLITVKDNKDRLPSKMFSQSYKPLVEAFDKATPVIGDKAKKLFEDFAKECDIIYKKQQETFNTQHEDLKEQYRSGKIDWKKYNSLYKKLSKEVNEEADNERRALFGGGVSGLQDIYDAVSKGTFRDTGQVTYGHGSAYYTDRRRTNPNCSESLANYASLCVGHPELIDILAEDYPEIVTALRGCVEAMLKEVPK